MNLIKIISSFAFIMVAEAGECPNSIQILILIRKYLPDWKIYNVGSGAPPDGISAGVDELMKRAFVGRGTVEKKQSSIGKLMVEATSLYGMGMYTGYGGKEYHITSGIEYYAKEPDCKYEWVLSSNGQQVPDAVGFTSDGYSFYVGRTHTFGSIEIGKVTLELKIMLYGWGGKEHKASVYEVLVCKPIFTPILIIKN